jgi:hypothetical protein
MSCVEVLRRRVGGFFLHSASTTLPLTCACGFEGHADLTASKTFLERQTEQAVRPMARPV